MPALNNNLPYNPSGKNKQTMDSKEIKNLNQPLLNYLLNYKIWTKGEKEYLNYFEYYIDNAESYHDITKLLSIGHFINGDDFIYTKLLFLACYYFNGVNDFEWKFYPEHGSIFSMIIDIIDIDYAQAVFYPYCDLTKFYSTTELNRYNNGKTWNDGTFGSISDTLRWATKADIIEENRVREIAHNFIDNADYETSSVSSHKCPRKDFAFLYKAIVDAHPHSNIEQIDTCKSIIGYYMDNNYNKRRSQRFALLKEQYGDKIQI